MGINLNSIFIGSIDNSINLFSETHQIMLLQYISTFLGTIFEPIYVIIFVILLSLFLLSKSKTKQAILLSAASLSSGVFIYLLKHIFSRARPLNGIIPETGFSFPSGHALISIILFGILIYFSSGIKSQTKRIISIVVCILGILLVGLSRVYLNAHWFSDVIAGYCFGLFILFSALFLYDFLKIKN